MHIEQPTILQEAHVYEAFYASARENVLTETVAFGGSREFYFRSRGLRDKGERIDPPVIRRSEDNGRTWKVIETWEKYHMLEGKWRWQRWLPKYAVDPKTDAMVRLFMGWLDIEGLVPWDKGMPTRFSGLRTS